MTGLAVKASGMVTSVGFNSASSCAAIRAGVRGAEETNLWDKESSEYLSAGRVHLPHWWVGTGKLAELVSPAIHECLMAAHPVRPEAIPILLGLSSKDRPCRFRDLDEAILVEVEHRLGFRLHPCSRLIPLDHISAVVALGEAEKLIAIGEAPCCIIAAVDSMLDQPLVEHYLEGQRMLTPIHSNGFTAGEAGSAVLVASPARTSDGELRVLGKALAREPATIDSTEPLRGDGLVAAIQEALGQAEVDYHDLDYRITDLNGEHYKFKELMLANMRLERKPRKAIFDIWHPIEYIGDVGAAIGPILFGLALHAGHKGYGTGPRALCLMGNDRGERAAIVFQYDPGECHE